MPPTSQSSWGQCARSFVADSDGRLGFAQPSGSTHGHARRFFDALLTLELTYLDLAPHVYHLDDPETAQIAAQGLRLPLYS